MNEFEKEKWTKVRKKNIKDFENEEEREKFTQLKLDHPHIMMPDRIRKIEQMINIEGLSSKVLSDESLEIQKNGYEYSKVITPFDILPSSSDFQLISLKNGWGDYILFTKLRKYGDS